MIRDTMILLGTMLSTSTLGWIFAKTIRSVHSMKQDTHKTTCRAAAKTKLDTNYQWYSLCVCVCVCVCTACVCVRVWEGVLVLINLSYVVKHCKSLKALYKFPIITQDHNFSSLATRGMLTSKVCKTLWLKHTHTHKNKPQSISIPNSTIQIKIKSTKTFQKHWQHQLNTQTIQTRNKTYSNLEQASKQANRHHSTRWSTFTTWSWKAKRATETSDRDETHKRFKSIKERQEEKAGGALWLTNDCGAGGHGNAVEDDFDHNSWCSLDHYNWCRSLQLEFNIAAIQRYVHR